MRGGGQGQEKSLECDYKGVCSDVYHSSRMSMQACEGFSRVKPD